MSPGTFLRQARLPFGLFDQEKVLLTTDEFFRLYNTMAEVSGDPVIGLKLGAEDRIEHYDPIYIAAQCTRSFRDAVGRLSRYKQLTCPEKIELVERANECVVHFNWLLAGEEEPAVLVDVCFAWILAIAARGMGRPISPKRVEFRRPEAYRRIHEKHFRCSGQVQLSEERTGVEQGRYRRPFPHLQLRSVCCRGASA